MLCDRDDRWDVVTGMGVVGCQEGVVKVQLAHCDSVGVCGPLGACAQISGEAEYRRACPSSARWMRSGLLPCRRWWRTTQWCRGDARIVDDPVDDHVDHVIAHLDGVGGHFGHRPGELPFASQAFLAAVNANAVVLHGRAVSFLLSVGEAGVVVAEMLETVM